MEFAPEFSVMLLSLLALAAALVALGLVASLQAFNRAVFGGIAKLLGWVPVFGLVLSSPINDVYKWLDSELGAVVLALDKRVGHYFHVFAAEVSWVGREIKEGAIALYQLAEFTNVLVPLWLLNQAKQQLGRAIDWAAHEAEVEAVRVYGIARKGIDASLRPLVGYVHGLERQIEHVLDPQIAGIRTNERLFGRTVTSIRRQLRTLTEATVGAGAAALVATALAQLGLSWIKCRNWKRLGRGVCGLPTNWISDLLGLVTDFLVLTDICSVIPWLEDAFSATAAPLVSALTTAGAGICNPNAKHPPTMNAPAPPAVPLYLTTLAVPGSPEYVASGNPQRVILLPGPTL